MMDSDLKNNHSVCRKKLKNWNINQLSEVLESGWKLTDLVGSADSLKGKTNMLSSWQFLTWVHHSWYDMSVTGMALMKNTSVMMVGKL